MKPAHVFACPIAVFFSLLFAPLTSAQTVILNVDRPVPLPPAPPDRPAPPSREMKLPIRQLAIETQILEGAAVTKVDQVFHNSHDVVVEGTYIFPLEDDVAISRFTMDVNGREVEGKLLDVAEARRTYEEIVRGMRDPALLEYVGKRMIKASIFPINPGTDVRIRLTYSQMLESKDGLVRYHYPLDVDKQRSSAIERFSFAASLESRTPIKSVFSPTHNLAISRSSDYRVRVSLEGSHVSPDRGLDLYYALSDDEFGLSILTYREPGEDGYFLIRIAPNATIRPEDVIPKDIIFVLDTSGSMAEENKIAQARAALKFCLSRLNEQDAFSIVTFAHEPRRFREGLVAAHPDNREAAVRFVDAIEAVGGTNINDALLSALKDVPRKDPARPGYLVFLTDGQPTVGVCKTEEILRNVREANDARTRIFVFGVGHDVNTQLLDLLAEQNRGTREYVEPGENLELALSSFYRRIADPVLSDLSLTMGDLGVYDRYPAKLNDLFGGMELVVLGRYSGDGPRAIELIGQRRGKAERYLYEARFPRDAREHDFLPRLWATRKVGYLMDEIRLHGEKDELKQGVIALAKRYGIVTPYTAYLVTEPGQWARRGEPGHDRLDVDLLPLSSGAPPGSSGAMSGDDAALRVMSLQVMSEAETEMDGAGGVHERPDAPPHPARQRTPGAAAVGRSREAKDMQQAHVPLFGVVGSASMAGKKANPSGHERVRAVGSRTFYLAGDIWIDSAYDRKNKTKKIEAFSDEYFKLAAEHQELAKCFALGERVIVVLGDTAYETVPPKREDGEKEKAPSSAAKKE